MSLTEKQNFLKENVIEDGLDPLKFTQYLENEVDSDFDIEKVDIKDLEGIVDSFRESIFLEFPEDEEDNGLIKKKKQNKVPEKGEIELQSIKKSRKLSKNARRNDDDSSGTEEEIITDFESVSNTTKKTSNVQEEEYSEDQESMDDDSNVRSSNCAFQKIIETQKLGPTLLSSHRGKDIVVTVSNPIKIEPTSFLARTYTLFSVRTENRGWEVLRRYNEFVWLCDTLKKRFPATYVPVSTNTLDPRSVAEDSPKERQGHYRPEDELLRTFPKHNPQK